MSIDLTFLIKQSNLPGYDRKMQSLPIIPYKIKQYEYTLFGINA